MIGRALTAMLLAGGLVLVGCAAPTSYAGIFLVPGAADPELQNLAQIARSGDKQAQLELGIRFEEGVGVAVDLKRAERFYRMAASNSAKMAYVYSPPTSKNDQGRIILIKSSNNSYGLETEKRRLEELKLRSSR